MQEVSRVPAEEINDNQATILVVDDNSINRMKMRMAIDKLGHKVAMASDGLEALEILRERPFDVVLLDIVMPKMDGFAVLEELKADSNLSDIPVIVVSALDDETSSVVKAIELGAEDFLPKEFDHIIMNARVNASLTKKRFRDTEREYYRRIERLTEAAEVLETGGFTPDDLELDNLARHNDPLGRLAAVFKGMAEEIYERERRLRRAVTLLQGSLLVLAVGVVWGLTPALARMASGLGSNPLGMAVWVNFVAAMFCFTVGFFRGKLPNISVKNLGFFLVWSIVAGILQRLTTFIVAQHVEAAMLSLIVTLQGFMVFAFAAATKLEKATQRRLAGLLVGLAGVAMVLITRFDPSSSTQNLWLGAALLLPLLFAIECILVAARRPDNVDVFSAVGTMMLLSGLMLTAIAYATGDMMNFGPQVGRLEILILLMGIGGAVSVLLCFHLIATAGAVFASQSAYAMTIAGIVWGMLLLNEELSPMAWLAVGIILLGLYLVEPSTSDDKVVLRRSFANRGKH